MRLPCLLLLFGSIAVVSAGPSTDEFQLPATLASFVQPVPYSALERILAEASRAPHVTVTREGDSIRGRGLWLVRIRTGTSPDPWRVFFYAQQHGNEPAGKDALLWMIADLARHPDKLPEGIELYILPMVNPDGAEAGQRRNANRRDLNRDHITLSQPETQTLHRIARRIMPHVAVDCHEFGRDGQDYAERGWISWPLIMMDAANHPLFDPEVTAAALRHVEAMRPVMAEAGFNYTRYYVGGPPPAEARHSHPELDDARNGVGAYGGMSFIIESGAFRRSATPHADLGQRVAAYHLLLGGFLSANDPARAAERRAIELARSRALPAFLPTNYFWANRGLQIRTLPVIEKASGRTLEIPSASCFDDLVVKTVVEAPIAYAIPARHAALFAPWLDRHGIVFTTLDAPRVVTGEAASLERLEKDEDSVYQRYGSRTITRVSLGAPVELPAGSLIVDLEQAAAVKAAILLEPGMLYGLAQYDEFAAIRADGLPLRVVK